jgi:hypothetical protein
MLCSLLRLARGGCSGFLGMGRISEKRYKILPDMSSQYENFSDINFTIHRMI